MDDGAKFRQITRGVINTHAISDDDLDWLLAILETPVTQYDDGSASSTARPIMAKMVTLGTLRLVKESTPQQQDKVFVALAPLLFGSDDINKAEADRALVAFKVTKAIPDIQPQLKDPNAGVRRVAKAALKALKA